MKKVLLLVSIISITLFSCGKTKVKKGFNFECKINGKQITLTNVDCAIIEYPNAKTLSFGNQSIGAYSVDNIVCYKSGDYEGFGTLTLTTDTPPYSGTFSATYNDGTKITDGKFNEVRKY